jgi:CpeT protein
VEIFADRLASWDRGWNKEDKQVWGAEKGGYVFIKQQ